MKIRKIKKLKVNSTVFNIKWVNEYGGAWFDYGKEEIGFNVKDCTQLEILNMINHELFEICCTEMHVRFKRPDVSSDYIFVFDHRQHTTIIEMMSGLLSEFLA